jgi:cytochrome c oxidase subunit I+III
VNLTFFPMHIAGLAGMPRRVWTYTDGMGLETYNLLSSGGALLLAVGFAIVFIDLLLHFRPAGRVDTNPWNAPTLEWLPMDNYAIRSIPRVTSREPLWQNASLRREVDEGRHYLPGLATGGRETIVTSPVSATPQYVLRLPGPSWLPLLAGFGTAAFFLCLTVKWIVPSMVGGAVALACILLWLWQGDPEPTERRYDIGGGILLPDHEVGSASHAWWASVVVLLVDGAVFASLVFGFYYLWTVSAGTWPPPGAGAPAPWFAAIAWILSAVAMSFAHRALSRDGGRPSLVPTFVLAVALMWIGLAALWLELRAAALVPTEHAYAAVAFAMLAWQALHVLLLTVMGAFVLARHWTGRLNRAWRTPFDCTRLILYYSVAQGVAIAAVLASSRLGLQP